MLETLIQMGSLIACGILWRLFILKDSRVQQTREALTGLVYYLFLPALVLLVMWQAPLGIGTFKIALIAASSILFAVIMMHGLCRLCRFDRQTAGAVILAAAFPNATYLGLPVLEATLGAAGRSIAIQYDLFACLPLLFTLGIWLATKYGTSQPDIKMSLWRIPAVWALLLAVILNTSQVAPPEALEQWLRLLANGVVPLMLISLGLSLALKREYLYELRAVLPVISLKLFLVPAFALLLAILLELRDEIFYGVILEAAMPSMVIGIIFCDRFGLNTRVYAAAVTSTTILSFATLEIWYRLAGYLHP